MATNPYITSDWRERFVVTAEITNPGERSALYRAASAGLLVRVAPGAFLPGDDWGTQTREQRHLSRMRAAALTRPGLTFSHQSAALAWGLPLIGPPPARPHVVTDWAPGGRSTNSLVRHTVAESPEWVEVDGLRVTAPARTALDVAATAAPEVSVPMLDVLLRVEPGDIVAPQATLDELRDGMLAIRSGVRRCTWAVEFADGRSESPGESLSRVGIHRIGLPAPDLQMEFVDRHGQMFTDFWWDEFGLAGEFDGEGKYLRDLTGRGRSTAEIVVEEKRREDRLRALGVRVIRWGWDVARSLNALRAELLAAGLRPNVSQTRP